MPKDRGTSETTGRGEAVEGRGAVASVLLVGSVTAILCSAWLLKSDAPHEIPGPVLVHAPPSTAELAIASPPVEPPQTVLTPTPVDADRAALAARAGNDVRRIERAAGPFTAQVLVACKPETVQRLLDSAGAGASLYVLPAVVQGSSCFRVCWGSYATAKDAAAAADLPPSLRSGDRVNAVEIARVLP